MADGTGKPRQLLTPKVAPHSEEAEMSVLGGIMLAGASAPDVLTLLDAQSFYFEKHRTIFNALSALAAKNRRLDFVTVADYLRSTGELEAVDGIGYLGQLVNDTPGAANVFEYANIVRERAALRECIAIGDRITEMGFRSEGRLASEVIDEAQSLTSKLGMLSTESGATSLADMITPWMVEHRERSQRRSGGLSTGLNDLDRAIKGLESGDLVVIGGRPGMGKTAFALGIAIHLASGGRAGLGFSMEMPKEQWVSRLVCLQSGVPMGKLREPWTLDDIDNTNISRALGDIGSLPFAIDDTPALSIKQLRSRARRANRQRKLSVIVVDYVQMMAGEGRKNDMRSSELESITRGLKSLGKELGCAVIALSSLNRELEKRDNKRPRMHDMKESGGFESDADIVIGLYRESEYNPECDYPDLCEAIILKQRNGPKSTVDLKFRGELFRFSDWDGPHREFRNPSRSKPPTRRAFGGKSAETDSGPAPGDYDDTPSRANGWSR